MRLIVLTNSVELNERLVDVFETARSVGRRENGENPNRSWSTLQITHNTCKPKIARMSRERPLISCLWIVIIPAVDKAQDVQGRFINKIQLSNDGRELKLHNEWSITIHSLASLLHTLLRHSYSQQAKFYALLELQVFKGHKFCCERWDCQGRLCMWRRGIKRKRIEMII